MQYNIKSHSIPPRSAELIDYSEQNKVFHMDNISIRCGVVGRHNESETSQGPNPDRATTLWR